MDGTNPLDEIMKTDNEFMMPFDDYSIGEQEQPRIEPYKTYEYKTTSTYASQSIPDNWKAQHPLNWETLLGLRYRFAYQVANAVSKLLLLNRQEEYQFLASTTVQHMNDIIDMMREFQQTEHNLIHRPRPLEPAIVQYIARVLEMERVIVENENYRVLTETLKQSKILLDLCRCGLYQTGPQCCRSMLYMFYRFYDLPYSSDEKAITRNPLTRFIHLVKKDKEYVHWLIVGISKFIGANKIGKQFMKTLVDLTLFCLDDDHVGPAMRYNLKFVTELCAAFQKYCTDRFYDNGFLKCMKFVLRLSPGVFFNTLDILHGMQQNKYYREELFEYLTEVVLTSNAYSQSKQINLCLRLINARLRTVRLSNELSKNYRTVIGDLLENDYCDRLFNLRGLTTDVEFTRTIYYAIKSMLDLCKKRYSTIYEMLISRFFLYLNLKEQALQDMQDVDLFDCAMEVAFEEARFQKESTSHD